MTGFSVASEELIHQGAVVGFFRREIKGPTGDLYQRDLVKHPGAVSVVAVEDDHMYLVKQYRAPLDAELVELPAGKLDVAGEPPEITAIRELEEEVGRTAATIEPLIGLYHSPGFCDEYGHIFLASELSEVPQRLDGPEEQEMTVMRVLITEAVEMAMDGRITDGKSIVGILAAARQLGM